MVVTCYFLVQTLGMAILGLALLLFGNVTPAYADDPISDSPLAAPAALEGLNRVPIAADDENFIADTGGDLDKYLFRPDRPDGKLKFNIGISRYYFNPDDSEIEFENGFLTEDALKHVVDNKILPAKVRLHLRVWDVDANGTPCPEVDPIWINGKPLIQNGIHLALTGANESWSELVVDVPISMLKFPKSKGTGLTQPTAAQNEIAIEIDWKQCGGIGKPNWAVEVDYGILEIRGPVRPVVFAHGWTGSTNSFKTIENNLASVGIPSGGQADLLEGIYPMALTAALLNQHIDSTLKEYGVDKVNVFAHSKGGLVSRWAVLDSTHAGKVQNLVTFDTPNHGTLFADALPLMNAMCHTLKYPFDPVKAALCTTATIEFTTYYVREVFNYDGCTYNLLTGRWSNCRLEANIQAPTTKYRALGVQESGPINSVLPDASAAYPWDANVQPLPRYLTDIRSGALTVYATDHSGILERTDSYQCAMNLLDSTRYSCPGAMTAAEVEAAAQAPEAILVTANQVILIQAGSLAGAGQSAAQVTFDGGAQILLEVYANTDLAFTLVEPGGRAITPAVASSDPLIDYAATNEDGMRRYAYVIANPRAGSWELHVQSTGPASFIFNGMADTPVSLGVTTNKTSYLPGETVTAQAALVQSGAALPGSVLTGSFEQPGGVSTPITFYDSGANGDPVANDGIYTSQFPAPTGQAHLAINVDADRAAVHREQSTLIAVSPQTATIGAVTRSWTEDSDSDGLIDRLMFRLNVNVLQAGHFDLQASLVNPAGEFVHVAQYVSRSQSGSPLAPGTHSVDLAFTGQPIWESGKDGPYRLTNLTLSDTTTQVFDVATANNIYTTPAYKASQFEHSAVRFESGTETATDTNGNGLYDRLTLNLRFGVTLSGNYNANGRLIDRYGREIAWSSGSFNAPSASSYPVSLVFPGIAIGNHMTDGPYILKDVSVYNQQGTAIAYFDTVLETQAYRYKQFENNVRRLHLPLIIRN